MRERRLCVRVDEKLSELYSVDLGVAQISVLEPQIFLLFINNLPDLTDGLVLNFADNIYIAISGFCIKILQNKIKKSTSELEEWYLKNKLILNRDESVMLYFTVPITHTKFLGCLF